jgi:hypothetical protein
MKLSAILIFALGATTPLAAFAGKVKGETATAQAKRGLQQNQALFFQHPADKYVATDPLLVYFDKVFDYDAVASKLKGAKVTLKCDGEDDITSEFSLNFQDSVVGTQWESGGDVVGIIKYKEDATTFETPMTFQIILSETGTCVNPKLVFDLRPTCVETTGNCGGKEASCAVFDYDLNAWRTTNSFYGTVEVYEGQSLDFARDTAHACMDAEIHAYIQIAIDNIPPDDQNPLGDLWFLYYVDLSPCSGYRFYQFVFDSDIVKNTAPEICGDPHIKTWSGKFFDYHGECDLVFIHAPDFDGQGADLDIHARTTIRYQYSYIESAAVQINGEILEVNAYGGHALNYVDNALAEAPAGLTVGGYPVYRREASEKQHFYDIVLAPGNNITLSSFKDLVAVHAGNHHFPNGVTGIVGSPGGDFLGRDGITDMSDDTNAFGQEWQVRDSEPNLFRVARAPQYPTQCNLPSAAVAEHRRLGETMANKEAAKKACAKYTGAEYFDICVYDVLATGDLEMAEAGAGIF